MGFPFVHRVYLVQVTVLPYNTEHGGVSPAAVAPTIFLSAPPNLQSLVSVKGTPHAAPSPSAAPIPHRTISMGRRPSLASRDLCCWLRRPRGLENAGLHIPLPYQQGRREKSGNLTLELLFHRRKLPSKMPLNESIHSEF